MIKMILKISAFLRKWVLTRISAFREFRVQHFTVYESVKKGWFDPKTKKALFKLKWRAGEWLGATTFNTTTFPRTESYSWHTVTIYAPSITIKDETLSIRTLKAEFRYDEYSESILNHVIMLNVVLPTECGSAECLGTNDLTGLLSESFLSSSLEIS